MAKKTYHTLLVRYENEEVEGKWEPWGIHFGSWERSEAAFELRTFFEQPGYTKDQFKIVKTDGTQESIDKLVAELNEQN